MRRHWVIVFVGVCLTWTAGCHGRKGAHYAAIRVAGHPVRVEIADNNALREQGLMFRESLPADHGMLFVYDYPEVLSFYMKNTSIPLSIAFIDSRGKIIRIADMKPFDLATHSSIMPARFALETNQGWFDRRGVKAGDHVEMPESITDAR